MNEDMAMQYQRGYIDGFHEGKAKFEPKAGYWNKDFICSVCGCKCYPMDIDFGDYNFCPNCGAKMIESQERSK